LTFLLSSMGHPLLAALKPAGLYMPSAVVPQMVSVAQLHEVALRKTVPVLPVVLAVQPQPSHHVRSRPPSMLAHRGRAEPPCDGNILP
jgi:hypothetical protein